MQDVVQRKTLLMNHRTCWYNHDYDDLTILLNRYIYCHIYYLLSEKYKYKNKFHINLLKNKRVDLF